MNIYFKMMDRIVKRVWLREEEEEVNGEGKGG
jgi:hypothetical protein